MMASPILPTTEVDRGIELTAGYWTMISIASAVLAVRGLARYTRRTFGFDDGFMAAGWVSSPVACLSGRESASA